MDGVRNIGRAIGRLLSSLWSFFRDVYLSFSYNHGTMNAAAISYYVYLSAVPVMLLTVACWGYLLGSKQDAQTIVFSYVKDYSPALVGDKSALIQKLVNDLISFRGPATWMGMLGLLWGGTGVIAVLDKAINLSFGVPGFRGFLKERLLALVMLPFMMILFGLSMLDTGWLQAIKNLESRVHWLHLSKWPLFWTLDGYVVPFLITVTAFFIIYFVMPRKRVTFKIAIGSALFTGVLWEITKQIFGYYASLFIVHNRIYGSLASIVLWMLWINASAIVTVMGAEFAAALTRRADSRKKQDKSESPELRQQAAQ